MKTIIRLACLMLPLFIMTCGTMTSGANFAGVSEVQRSPEREPETVSEDDSVSTLVINNTTPYEITSIYAQDIYSGEWSNDLLDYQPLSPNETREIPLPAGNFTLQADILVDDSWYTLEEGIDSNPGKKYSWKIDNALFAGYTQAYGYLDGSYGYLGSYDYLEM